jgi:co-chaperonin GroES (HSP10)
MKMNSLETKPRLLRTELGEFEQNQSAVNDSGYQPIGDRVLIKVDNAASTSSGGVHLPDDVVYKQTMAAETGIIVALGDAAFKWTFDRSREWYGYRPEVGNRVYVERYAGRILKGKDGVWYRLMDDTCVAGIEIKE